MNALKNDERLDMRLSRELVERLDDWRWRQITKPSRSAAARALLEAALAVNEAHKG